MSNFQSQPLLAWHFLRKGGVTRDGQTVTVGSRMHVNPPVIMGERELHASLRLLDALRYTSFSPVACRVRMSGEIIKGSDKIVATDREVLAMVDATKILHEFACVVAEEALQKAGVTDKRSWNVIALKRRWLSGDDNDREFSAAKAAAREAAEADWRVDRKASASRAAKAAAKAAVWAADLAAESAAFEAVSSVLEGFRGEEFEAERSRLNDILTRMVEEALL